MISGLRTIADILEHQAKHRPDRIAMIDPDARTLLFGDLWQETQIMAQALSDALSGTTATHLPRLGLVLPNGPQISLALLAATSVACAAPFNPAHTRAEFEDQFAATQIDAVLLPQGATGAAVEAAHALLLPLLYLTPDRRIVTDTTHPGENRGLNAPGPDDIGLVLMTSGSTGKPKVVPLTQRNLCRSAEDVARSLSLSDADRCLAMWEQFHIGGLVDLLIAPLIAGSSVVTAGSFDAARALALQAQHRATWFQGVPTTLGELMREAGKSTQRPKLTGLRFLRSVAAGLSPSAQERLEDFFGVPVVRTLGMTEAGPLITSTRHDMLGHKMGSVGRSAGPEVVILTPHGDKLSAGRTGQVAIRGENVFSGYEHDPDANLMSFRNGWFLTGDLGYLDDDGDLFLTGREKEMINRGGEKIAPSEVEDALLRHTSVREAACFGLPHATLGEDIVCAVATQGALDAEALRRHLAVWVAPHKVPGRIIFATQLPKNPVGKVDRLALAARAQTVTPAKPIIADALTDMEQLITDIWKEELSLTQVGPNEDFASVDGDSLSAVRILVAIETHFGRPVPEEIIARFATIRALAAGLESNGFRLDDAKADTVLTPTIPAPELAETLYFSGDADQARKLIATARGRSDLRLRLDHIVAHLAPSEVTRLVDVLKEAKPGSDSAGFVERLRMAHAYAQGLADIRRHLPHGKAAPGWSRQQIAPGALLFTDSAGAASQKTLLVGFSGNRMRLLMPAFRFLAAVDADSHDVLLLSDHRRALFRDGLAPIAQDLPALARYIGQFCDAGGYQRLVGVGTSGGSLAVLLVGIMAGFDAIACVAPASLEKHGDWISCFETIAAQHDPDSLPIRIVHGRRERHREAARSIGTYLPQAELIRYPHAGKNIFPDAQDRGVLRPLLQKWLS